MILHEAPEWGVLRTGDNRDGRLVIVERRAGRGACVKYPQGHEPAFKVRADQLAPFVPEEYPVQISGPARRRLMAEGKTPIDEVEKVCNTCFTLKPIDQFAKNQTRKDGSSIRRPACVSCRSGLDGVNKREHEVNKQGGRAVMPPVGSFWECPICRQRGIVMVTVKLVLDHDHLSGHAREYICDRCNTGLGRFRNGKDFVQNVIDYLSKWD